jgi:pyruvate formate lyase activating enzyme
MSARMAVQKTSLIDYPGRVAAVLFLPGCNFRCPYCHNPQLVAPPFPEELVSLEEVLRFLESRRRVLTGVVLTGGEPLLHEDLPELAAAVRKLGFLVKLDTNGSSPERIANVAADFIALDLKTSPEHYERVAPGLPGAGEKVLESLRVIRSLAVPYEIRVTCAPGIVDYESIRRIAELLEPEDAVALQDFRPMNVLDPAWRDVSPFPESTLKEFADTLRSRAASVRIRSSV